jgi:hypothetical protein
LKKSRTTQKSKMVPAIAALIQIRPPREADEVADKDVEGDAGEPKKGKTDADRLKNTRDELLRKSQENADLKRKLDELSGKIEGVIQMAQTKSEQKEEANPFSFLDDEATLDNLYEDPKNMAKVLKQMVGYIGQTLSARDKALLEEVQNRVKEVDPERKRLAAKVAELRNDSDFSSFTDEQLIVLAKREAAKAAKDDDKDEDTQVRDGYRGGIGGSGGGSGRRVVQTKEKAKDPLEEKFYRMLKPEDE